MAHGHWSTVADADVLPEVRLARRVLQDEQAAPPVDVQGLLLRHAHLERVAVPVDVDGLVYTKLGELRPRVIINTRLLSANRERFTMAHELGHILIPWQFGDLSCHTDEQSLESSVSNATRYRTVEDEANRFAAELLLPARWLTDALAQVRGGLSQRVLAVASSAKVSPMVAGRAVANLQPRTIAYFLKDGMPTFVIFGRVFGRPGKQELTPEREADYMSYGAVCGHARFGPYTLRCVEFPSIDVSPRPKYPSSVVLDEIIGKVTKDPQSQRRLQSQVQGVVGAANNGRLALGTDEVLTLLQHRFSGRYDTTGVVVKHARFAEYLLARAYELAAGDERRTPARNADTYIT